MPEVLEHQVRTLSAQRPAPHFQADEIARDLALLDDLEAFVQSLPKRSQGQDPTPQELREIAYDDREAPTP